MGKKILHITIIIIISIIGFCGGIFIAVKIRNINVVNQKAQVLNEEEINTKVTPLVIIEKTEDKIIDDSDNKKIEAVENKLIEAKKQEKTSSSNCPEPKKDYENMMMLPLGQKIGLEDTTYTPSDLQELNTASSTKAGICLIKEAGDSFEEMVAQAKKDGYDIKASSGFRSYTYQKNLLSNAIKNGNTNAKVAIAKAGHSEHQLGTAVDITGQSIQYDSASQRFNKTKEAKWVEKNASEYGFIMSYQKGKEDITGYMYEPWHYRYVGKDAVNKIIDADKTLNEYLEGLLKKS